eukprot:gb/GECG01000796.1/.p1 GENE.gb/GECG01000796.1/~~gb/GECG01000796.1/.p1  ORF type:complete len:683 (+),score=82.04 gb/GECG01000796.1/:1-2049(+)
MVASTIAASQMRYGVGEMSDRWSLGKWSLPQFIVGLPIRMGMRFDSDIMPPSEPSQRRKIKQPLSPSRTTRSHWSSFFAVGVSIAAIKSGSLVISAGDLLDLRGSIQDGREECFQFFPGSQLFQMNCSVLSWKSQSYTGGHYISLGVNETFDGGAESMIDLSGVNAFNGLLRIRADVGSFLDAPLIRNVHIKNGKTSAKGGFIVGKQQKYFEIDSCSSTGDIGVDGGGICGFGCGQGYGQIKISNCYSTGNIADKGGGITGANTGKDGGTVYITQCYSRGQIAGSSSGGICGSSAGYGDGLVHISQSYSTGDLAPILGTATSENSGGIVGATAASSSGFLRIDQCYSTGRISSGAAGGITGFNTAETLGEVYISNCYSRGDISGDKAGGITGGNTGGDPTTDIGKVHITNSYASGSLQGGTAGGIIGSIVIESRHDIRVKYSVYNDIRQERIAGVYEDANLNATGNSGDLDDIQGQLFKPWSDEYWALNGSDNLPVLRFQLPRVSPSPSPSSTSTATASITPAESGFPSWTRTASPLSSRSPKSANISSQSMPSSTSMIRTPTSTMTPSFSPSKTQRGSVSISPFRTETPSPSCTYSKLITAMVPPSNATFSATESLIPSATHEVTASPYVANVTNARKIQLPKISCKQWQSSRTVTGKRRHRYLQGRSGSLVSKKKLEEYA